MILMVLAVLGGLLALRVALLLVFGRGTPMKAGSGPVKTMIVLGSGACGREESKRSGAAVAPTGAAAVPAGSSNADRVTYPSSPLADRVTYIHAIPSRHLAGGHTAEMLMLVEKLDKVHYAPRVYVVAASDRMSGTRALTKEQGWGGGAKASGGGGCARVGVC
jgi:hypothetical protein